MRGDNGPRIEEVERRAVLLDTDERNIQRRLVALEQGLWATWSEVFSPIVPQPTPTPTPTPTPNTGVSGTLFGCTTSGIPGTITVVDAGTSAVYYSGSTNGSGVWSGTFYLASNTSCIITATPTSARSTAASITRTLTAGTTNTGLNITAGVAAGFVCSKACPLPIATTLTLASTGVCAGNSFPSDTLTWSATVPARFHGAGGATPGWYGAASFTLTTGAGGGTQTYGYLFTINSLGNLGLGAIPITAGGASGITLFLANPLLGACAPFLCSTNCAAQGIGSTIHE